MARKAGRKRYSTAEKKRILALAAKEGLTGAQVQKRFGIAQLTFYRWRGPVRGPRARAAAATGAGAGAIREEVRRGVRLVLPGVIRQEVLSYLNEILGRRGPGRPPGSGTGRRRRPGRPKKK